LFYYFALDQGHANLGKLRAQREASGQLDGWAEGRYRLASSFPVPHLGQEVTSNVCRCTFEYVFCVLHIAFLNLWDGPYHLQDAVHIAAIAQVFKPGVPANCMCVLI
jgi:hypothetical protein